MKPDKIKNSFLIIIIAFISAGILFPTDLIHAQNYLRINDDIGGGGSNTTNESNSNDNTLIYVLGGAIVVGIVVYALVFNKKKKDEPKNDSTALLNSSTGNLISGWLNNSSVLVEKAKEKIPVELNLSIRNNKALLNDKTYMLGVSVKF